MTIAQPADDSVSSSAPLPHYADPPPTHTNTENQRYRDLFQTAPIGYLITSATGQIEESNRRIARLLNVAPDDLTRMPLATFITLAQRHTFRGNLAEVTRTRAELTWNSVLTPLNKPPFWAQLHVVPVLQGGDMTQLLWAIQDITPQRELEHTLESERSRMQLLSHRLVEGQEAERRQIARELHSEIGQALTGLKLTLEHMCARTPAQAADLPCDSSIDPTDESMLDVPVNKGQLSEALAITTRLMSQVRALSLQLRPPMLDSLGLIATVRWHVAQFTAQTGVTVQFTATEAERRYQPRIELAAYRLIQEALTNVARHAQVTEAFLTITADQNTLHITIEDHGRGFDSAQVQMANRGSGLIGMQERVTLVGGQLNINSQPGGGTQINAQLHLGHFE